MAKTLLSNWSALTDWVSGDKIKLILIEKFHWISSSLYSLYGSNKSELLNYINLKLTVKAQSLFSSIIPIAEIPGDSLTSAINSWTCLKEWINIYMEQIHDHSPIVCQRNFNLKCESRFPLTFEFLTSFSKSRLTVSLAFLDFVISCMSDIGLWTCVKKKKIIFF